MSQPDSKTIEFKEKTLAHMDLRQENYDTVIEAAKDALILGAQEFDVNMADDKKPIMDDIVLKITISALSAVPTVGSAVSAAVDITHSVASSINDKDERNKRKLKKMYLIRTMSNIFRQLNASKSQFDKDKYNIQNEMATMIGRNQKISNSHLEQYKIKYPMVPSLTRDGSLKIEKRMLKELILAHCNKYVYLILRNMRGCKYTLHEMTPEQFQWIKRQFLEINVIDDLHTKWGVRVTSIVSKPPKPGWERKWMSSGGGRIL